MSRAKQKKRNPRVIDEELVCIDSLMHTLKTICNCSIGVPRPVPTGVDPPDFWLPVEERDFGVEVTSIVQSHHFRHHTADMARAIRAEAIANDRLAGTYVLLFRRSPRIPHPKRKDDRGIFEAAQWYIETTRHVDEGAEASLLHDSTGEILLKKLTPNGTKLEPMWISVESGPETEANLRDLIDSAAKSKIKKLAKNGHDSKDCILALYDAYAFGDWADVQAAVADLTSILSFHSVYWAGSFTDRPNATFPDEPGRNGGFLWSTEDRWNGSHSFPHKNAEP